MKKLSAAVAVALCFSIQMSPLTQNAHAQSWQFASGKIGAIAFSGDTNFAFRIFLVVNGTNPLANACQYGFVYLNNLSGENYQAKVAGLMTANAQGKTVEIYYVIDSSGFCHMTDFTLFPTN